MEITLPSKLEIKDAKNNRAEIILEPCYPGYGVTLGNALRRVLLSSLEGAAIIAFKVNGVMHEFSSLPNVKEDLVEMILNLKRIRLKTYSEEVITLNLKVKGEKVVKAGDIEKNSDVEISNPDQVIATLTDKSAELEMELKVQKGRGYVTVEERSKEKVELGIIMIDALYTPVVNVGFEVEQVRVGGRTDYDKLVMRLETDGSLTPREALTKAAEILVSHFNIVSGESAAADALAEKEEKESGKAVAPEVTATAETAAADLEAKPVKKRGRPRKTDK